MQNFGSSEQAAERRWRRKTLYRLRDQEKKKQWLGDGGGGESPGRWVGGLDPVFAPRSGPGPFARADGGMGGRRAEQGGEGI